MFAKVRSFGFFGISSFEVEVEVDASRGMPSFNIVGLPDTAIKESKDRIRSALKAIAIKFPILSIMVNLAPADTKKSGSVHDMAILVAILKATNIINENTDDSAFIGEVSLNGRIRHINGVLAMVMKAYESGIKNIFVPKENAFEASVVEGINVYAVESVEELIDHFCNIKYIKIQEKYIPPETEYDEIIDFSDVKGQYATKFALEIAAAGGHNVMMIGSPGSGKSMLAKRIPTILPPLSFRESIETTNIHSIAGLLDKNTPIITKRPFRSPHHTISSAGLTGGGTFPHPGEISLAHNGVLFLDEFAEFEKHTIEAMRQPIEDGYVTISRVSGTVVYPCSVMLIGAMNPCPCGYYGHPTHKCTCPSNKVRAYLSKLSGPVIDRFDLHVDVAPVNFDDMSSVEKGESSKEIRERVIRARKIQLERFKGTNIKCNAQIPASGIQKYCIMDDSAFQKLKQVFEKMDFSGRSYNKILMVSRTIADLENSELITKRHISQAVQFRSLDRKYWN